MNKLIILLCILFSNPAYALHLNIPKASVDIDTNKVTRIDGQIDLNSERAFISSLLSTSAIPGDRIIIINSQGGYVDSGASIIRAMETEKAAGVREICVVMGQATSMAFNILTHCDVRLATSSSYMLVHKIAVGGLDNSERWTGRNLRKIADELDKDDEEYRQGNAKAMHLSLRDYDQFADAETTWTARQLLDRGYLQGLVHTR